MIDLMRLVDARYMAALFIDPAEIRLVRPTEDPKLSEIVTRLQDGQGTITIRVKGGPRSVTNKINRDKTETVERPTHE